LVLTFQLLQPLGLIHLQPAILAAPAIVRRFGYPNGTDSMARCLALAQPYFDLTQMRDDLLRIEVPAADPSAPLSEPNQTQASGHFPGSRPVERDAENATKYWFPVSSSPARQFFQRLRALDKIAENSRAPPAPHLSDGMALALSIGLKDECDVTGFVTRVRRDPARQRRRRLCVHGKSLGYCTAVARPRAGSVTAIVNEQSVWLT
jgi:hypothetical protein